MPTFKQSDFEKLSIAELEGTAALIETVIEAKRAAELAKLRETVAKQAEALGFNVKDVFGEKRKPAAPKYRNPESGKTWTGRGRAPDWIAPLNDKQREKMLIKV